VAALCRRVHLNATRNNTTGTRRRAVRLDGGGEKRVSTPSGESRNRVLADPSRVALCLRRGSGVWSAVFMMRGRWDRCWGGGGEAGKKKDGSSALCWGEENVAGEEMRRKQGLTGGQRHRQRKDEGEKNGLAQEWCTKIIDEGGAVGGRLGTGGKTGRTLRRSGSRPGECAVGSACWPRRELKKLCKYRPAASTSTGTVKPWLQAESVKLKRWGDQSLVDDYKNRDCRPLGERGWPGQGRGPWLIERPARRGVMQSWQADQEKAEGKFEKPDRKAKNRYLSRRLGGAKNFRAGGGCCGGTLFQGRVRGKGTSSKSSKKGCGQKNGSVSTRLKKAGVWRVCARDQNYGWVRDFDGGEKWRIPQGANADRGNWGGGGVQSQNLKGNKNKGKLTIQNAEWFWIMGEAKACEEGK